MEKLEKLEKKNYNLTRKLESCQEELRHLRKAYSIHCENCDENERELLLQNEYQNKELMQKEMECERLKEELDHVQKCLNELQVSHNCVIIIIIIIIMIM